ncbi:hypothetical protein RND81_11G055600 [Saponaria officinalis]|uniref:CCHC-type domain-containing protein n=1 Tax=Saponaria officinalis TaxID=3572 RepID=A0AAW1HIA3_SAPOF
MNQNLIQVVTQMNQARNPNAASDMTEAVSLQRPEYFDGKGDPVKLEAWVRSFDKIFTTLNCEENLRIPHATHYLVDNADIWWTENKDRLMAPMPRNDNGVNIVRAMNWEEFKTALRKLVPTPESRASRFEQGLDINIRVALGGWDYSTILDVYTKASNVERIFNERNAAVGDKRKNYSGMSEPTQGKKPNYTRSYSMNKTANTSNSYFCKSCNRDHHRFYCDGNPWKCAYCGRTGHRTSECRTRLREQGNQYQNNNFRQTQSAGAGSSITRPQTRRYQGGNRYNNNSVQNTNAKPTTSTATTGAKSTGQVNATTAAQHPQNQGERAATSTTQASTDKTQNRPQLNYTLRRSDSRLGLAPGRLGLASGRLDLASSKLEQASSSVLCSTVFAMYEGKTNKVYQVSVVRVGGRVGLGSGFVVGMLSGGGWMSGTRVVRFHNV